MFFPAGARAGTQALVRQGGDLFGSVKALPRLCQTIGSKRRVEQRSAFRHSPRAAKQPRTRP